MAQAKIFQTLRVTGPVDFDALDPAATLGETKEAAHAETEQRLRRLGVLQTHLYAESTRSLLLVLQGMDASGKDGLVRRVFTGVNPQGCRVVSFKVPSELERGHDYLWRIHAALPRRGEIGIFNRSHYEDLVTTEVIGLIDRECRDRRVQQVKAFERMLTDEGTTIVKVFLHVGKDEQRARLQARVDDPEKRWKFNPSDLETRALWKAYHRAYAEVLEATSTDQSPWFVVPANRKWVRDLAVSTLVNEAVEALAPRIPSPDGVAGITVE